MSTFQVVFTLSYRVSSSPIWGHFEKATFVVGITITVPGTRSTIHNVPFKQRLIIPKSAHKGTGWHLQMHIVLEFTQVQS